MVNGVFNIEYDIAIVGAGPAGAIFAREMGLAKPEMKILLIDGQGEINRKPCGGLLAPDAQKALARFSLTLPKRILADPQIFTVETIDLKTRRTRYYQRHYLNMDRYAFDSWLVSLVPSCVDVIKGRCEGAELEESGFKLKLSSDGSAFTVTAKNLVGADGGSSVVRRSFFKIKLKQYVSIQQWFENKGQQLPYYSCIFDPETSESCSWTIHKDNYLIFGGAFDKQGCREAYESQKKRLEEFLGNDFGDAVKTEACLVSSPRKMGDFTLGKSFASCQNGVYLIGEAAGLISSSSFEGISSAILSGKYLSESFLEADGGAEVIRLYKKKTLGLRVKLCMKNPKRFVICNPFLRNLVMKSGIQSVEKY